MALKYEGGIPIVVIPDRAPTLAHRVRAWDALCLPPTSPPDNTQPATLILLASRSPRRREMLTRAGIAHVARHPGIDDTLMVPGEARRLAGAGRDEVAAPGTALDAEQWVAALAYLKADAALRCAVFTPDELARASWVLGADTAVVKGNDLIGTPLDAADAERIIRALSGGEHAVVTGMALVRPDRSHRLLITDRAHVRVGALSDAQIRDYIASGLWQGKAGAYNLAERLAAGWPIHYTGDPDTVMGLAMIKLLQTLGR